uniref:Transcriptional regulator n=1 Tax=Parastrongyloides trichosuri TaxID=131310 RepID=A0A0N4Z3D4_PARTI
FLGRGPGNVHRHRIDRQADDDNRATGTRQVHDGLPGVRRTRAFEHHIGAPAFSQPRHFLDDVLVANIDRNDALILGSNVELGLRQIGDDHPRTAPGQRGNRHHGANRARAQHHRRIARLDRGLAGRLHPNGKWLYHCAFGKAHIVGQLESVIGRMHHFGGQDTMDRRRRPKAHGRIDIIHAQAAGPRIGIGNPWLHADAVAHLEMSHARTDFGHCARRFMAQHHRLIDHEWPNLAVGIVMHVRATHAHGVNGDLDLTRPDFKRQLDIAQRELVLFFQHEGADFAHVLFPFKSITFGSSRTMAPDRGAKKRAEQIFPRTAKAQHKIHGNESASVLIVGRSAVAFFHRHSAARTVGAGRHSGGRAGFYLLPRRLGRCGAQRGSELQSGLDQFQHWPMEPQLLRARSNHPAEQLRPGDLYDGRRQDGRQLSLQRDRSHARTAVQRAANAHPGRPDSGLLVRPQYPATGCDRFCGHRGQAGPCRHASHYFRHPQPQSGAGQRSRAGVDRLPRQ